MFSRSSQPIYMRHAARRRRRGSVLVLVACALTALLGAVALGVDYGSLVMDANRLQRGCDAAVLAGATRLQRTGVSQTDRYNATVDAQKVAWQNDKVAVLPADVTFANDRTIKVSSTITRRFFFGAAIGVPSGVVRRSATAAVRPVTELSTQGPIRVAPIGITLDTYNAYKNDQTNSHEITLVRQNKTAFGKDDLVLFDLRDTNAKSGAAMLTQLIGATDETAVVGDYETTLNAASPAERIKLTGGLDTLFAKAALPPYNDTATDNVGADAVLSGAQPRTNPRVVYLIVTNNTSSPSNGTFDTEILGYVPVYLEDYDYDDDLSSNNGKGKGGGNSANSGLSISMRFLPATLASGTGLPTSVDPNTTSTGISSISLTD